MTILGMGMDAVQIDCTPGAPIQPLQFRCDYQASRLWGVWTTHAGSVHDVLALEGDRGRSAKGGDTWAVQLRTPQRNVTISPHAAAPIATRVFQAFEAGKLTDQPFTVRSLQINSLVALLSSVFLALGLLFLAALPLFLRPMPTDPRLSGRMHLQNDWWRVGRDDSFIALGMVAIPVWPGLVALYVLAGLVLVDLAAWLPHNTARIFAGSGPALLAVINLGIRLRTAEY